MASNHDDQSSIRRYLLHQLTEEERQQIEQRLLADDDLFDQLQATEDEGIDQSVAGALSRDDAEMFEKLCLVTAERQQKARFAKAFSKYVSSHTSELPAKTTNPAGMSWDWPKFFSAPSLRA